MKKFFIVFLFLLCFLMGCSKKDNNEKNINENNSQVVNDNTDDNKTNVKDIKIGVITLHGETSTDDYNFIKAVKNVINNQELSIDKLIIDCAEEDDSCLLKCTELVGKGCNVIFGNAFGYEQFFIQAAKIYKNVEFCLATGIYYTNEIIDNYHVFNVSNHESKYLTGVCARMKLNEMK